MPRLGGRVKRTSDWARIDKGHRNPESRLHFLVLNHGQDIKSLELGTGERSLESRNRHGAGASFFG